MALSWDLSTSWFDWSYTFLAEISQINAGLLSMHFLNGHTMLICPADGDVKFDQLVEVVEGRFLHCQVTIFSL